MQREAAVQIRDEIWCRKMGDVDSVPFWAPSCHLDKSLTVSDLHQ